jgi:hypothetical protein
MDIRINVGNDHMQRAHPGWLEMDMQMKGMEDFDGWMDEWMDE